MKITCHACAAKYTIADDKVVGKIVKIRCKKCGATLVVNGNDPSASTAPTNEGAAPFDYTAQGTQGDTWTVNVGDGDQRTMGDGEIVAAYRSGTVNDETFCWKDGMNDWLPIRDIEPLRVMCTSGGNAVPDLGLEAPGASALISSRPPPSNGGPAPAPIAARRVNRATGDLFGAAAQAGGEDEVMTSAPAAGMPQAHHDDGKLTGARNENSVLFSLNALTSKGGPDGKPMTASAEASGLIDIRQLSSQIGITEASKKASRIDDIMNLAGGGAFSPSLAGPVLAAPPLEEYAEPAPGGSGSIAAPASKSKGLIFAAIGGGALVIVLAVGAAFMMMGNKSETASADKGSPSASAAELAPSAAPAASAVAAAATAPAPTASAPSAPSPAAATPDTSKAAATTAPTAADHATAKAATASTPKPEAPAAAAPAAAAGADQPFNMGEAKARLASIAGSVQSCKKGDISGSGRVVVTFAPSGAVQSAAISGPPFEGTPTGGCVAAHFRSAHVPAFTGSPFSVSKSFTIN